MGFWSSLFGGNAAVQQAREWMAQGATVLDVRTREEFASGHLANAKNIPVQELPMRLKQVGKKGERVVVYCRSGGRSAQARMLLQSAGYQVCDVGPMSALQ